MKQHRHQQEFLLPGTVCDVYRKPNRKDEYGWHGPCELVSIQREAGSCIVVHNGIPLIVALSHIRRHLVSDLFCHLITNAKDKKDVELNFVNYQLVASQAHVQKILFLGKPPVTPAAHGSSLAEVLIKIMEIVEGETLASFTGSDFLTTTTFTHGDLTKTL